MQQEVKFANVYDLNVIAEYRRQQNVIVPTEWFKIFTNKRGGADHALIMILAEILHWYIPDISIKPKTGEFVYTKKFTGDAWPTSYAYFTKILLLRYEYTRCKLVKLEQQNIITRKIKTVVTDHRIYNNKLFIHLNKNFTARYLPSCIKQQEEMLKNYAA